MNSLSCKFFVNQSSVRQALHSMLVCGKSSKAESVSLLPGQGDYVMPKSTFERKMALLHVLRVDSFEISVISEISVCTTDKTMTSLNSINKKYHDQSWLEL